MNELTNYGLEALQTKFAQLIREYSNVLFSDDRKSLPGLEERIYKVQEEISRRSNTPPTFPFKSPPHGGFKMR
jgi:hypothetical protein